MSICGNPDCPDCGHLSVPIEKSLNDLQCECHEIAVNKGWWEHKRNHGECIALMHSELSEALEGLRKGNWENVGEELADTVIRIMDFCQANNLNLYEEIVKKMEYNRQREYKHGGKKF